MVAKNKLAVQISDTEARIRGLVKLLSASDQKRPQRLRELEKLRQQLSEYRKREKEQEYE